MGSCVTKALGFLSRAGIEGEVIVADNGSRDGSQEIAREHGARVVDAAPKGYGSALMAGIEAASGTFIIMGDADESYDFANLDLFVKKPREGHDLVMGNRFLGGVLPGAMPFMHRYVGNPILSGLGRFLFGAVVGDFHCGLRGFRKDAYTRLQLQTVRLAVGRLGLCRSRTDGEHAQRDSGRGVLGTRPADDFFELLPEHLGSATPRTRTGWTAPLIAVMRLGKGQPRQKVEAPIEDR